MQSRWLGEVCWGGGIHFEEDPTMEILVRRLKLLDLGARERSRRHRQASGTSASQAAAVRDDDPGETGNRANLNSKKLSIPKARTSLKPLDAPKAL